MSRKKSNAINEIFDRVVFDYSEKFFPTKNKRHIKRLAILFSVILAAGSILVYSVIVKANVFNFYPATCLGTWDNPQYAEGEPTLSPNTPSGQFNKDNSSFFGGGIKQIFCGGFRNDDDVADKIFQKAILKFSWAVTVQPEPPILKQSEYDQQIIDLPASASITVIPDQTISSSSLETSASPSPQNSPKPFVLPTIQPTVTLTPIPIPTASVSSELSPSPLPIAIPTGTPEVEPPVEVQPLTTPTDLPTPQPSPSATAAPTPIESPSSLNFISNFFALRTFEAIASQSLTTSQVVNITTPTPSFSPLASPLKSNDKSNDIASRKIDVLPSQVASLSQSLDDFLEVLYTTDGQNWLPLARVSENNLDSLELELPVSSWDELENLQISLRGLGTSDLEKKIYLDGMWIEAEYGEIDASIRPADNEAARELLKNREAIKIDKTKIIKQRENKKDFRADEEPIFEINTDFPIPASDSIVPTLPSDNIPAASSPSTFKIKNIFLSWFKKIMKPEFASAQLNNQVVVQVFDYVGYESDVQPVVENINGKISVRLIKGDTFKPGKYELRVLIIKDGQAFLTSQDFTWGVLAINTDKSIYLPGENSDLAIAVLSALGEMVCDAEVELTITDPIGKTDLLSTANKAIVVNPECSQKKVTVKPDYETHYRVATPGLYQMSLSAKTLTGVWTIKDNFEVRPQVDFDVQRISATRIFPVNSYPVTLLIKANQDFQGQIHDYVPAPFVIEELSSNGFIADNPGEKIISWDVNMKKGMTYKFSYKYKAPNISPQFYLLGPLDIGIFKETRKWQIAVDTDINDNIIMFFRPASASNDTNIPAGWTCISCSGQAYDNKFPVASSSFGTGGAKTHGAQGTLTHSTPAASDDDDATGTTVAARTHTHSLSVTDSNPSNYPLYARLMMIKYTGALPLTSLPDNVIGMFDGTPPAGWSPLTEFNNRIIIASDSADPANAGADTHDHTLTWGSLGASAGTVLENTSTTVIALNAHTHTAPTASTTDTLSNVPQHASVILATANGTITDFTGLLAMFDATPDSQWTQLGGSGGVLENDFIEASTSYNVTPGGANTHTHANVTSGGSGSASGSSSTSSTQNGQSVPLAHTHTITQTATASTNRPPYKGIIMAKFNPPAGTITLSLDAGGVTALGTLTNGTRVTGTTRLKAVQTGASSLTITAGRLRAISNVTLASAAAPLVAANQISDTAGGIDVFNTIATCATAGSHPAVWGTGVSTGLGFSNWAATSGKDTGCWGTGTTATDALNQYAALQASASASSFINIAASPPATLYASIGYSLDVASSQKATTYAGGVVFTATVAP